MGKCVICGAEFPDAIAEALASVRREIERETTAGQCLKKRGYNIFERTEYDGEQDTD